jgi:hypothetical protein
MYEYRCDERLKVKDEGSTHLGYTSRILRNLEILVKKLLFIYSRIKKGRRQKGKKKCHTKTIRGK